MQISFISCDSAAYQIMGANVSVDVWLTAKNKIFSTILPVDNSIG
jgi:hypothetical protein